MANDTQDIADKFREMLHLAHPEFSPDELQRRVDSYLELRGLGGEERLSEIVDNCLETERSLQQPELLGQLQGIDREEFRQVLLNDVEEAAEELIQEKAPPRPELALGVTIRNESMSLYCSVLTVGTIEATVLKGTGYYFTVKDHETLDSHDCFTSHQMRSLDEAKHAAEECILMRLGVKQIRSPERLIVEARWKEDWPDETV